MTGSIVVGNAMTHLGIEWFFVTLFLLLSAIYLYSINRTSSLRTGFAIDAMEEEQLEEEEDSKEVFESQLNETDDSTSDTDNTNPHKPDNS